MVGRAKEGCDSHDDSPFYSFDLEPSLNSMAEVVEEPGCVLVERQIEEKEDSHEDKAETPST